MEISKMTVLNTEGRMTVEEVKRKIKETRDLNKEIRLDMIQINYCYELLYTKFQDNFKQCQNVINENVNIRAEIEKLKSDKN